MSRKRKDRARLAALDALYAQLPRVQCRGLCATACTRIPLTELEAARLRAASPTRQAPQTTPEGRCIYLNARDRCTQDNDRPLICRAYGVVNAMSCPHGCEPDRWMDDLEFLRIAQAIESLGGRLLWTDHDGLAHDPHASFLQLGPTRDPAAIARDSE